MQYSTLRISTIIAVFSASTALAYLDCGGGRAPPKTTVPGCPGYQPTDAASQESEWPTPTITVTAAASTKVVLVTSVSTASSEYDDTWDSDYSYNSDGIGHYTGDDDGLCACSGYLCEFAEPGCVAVNADTGARSTITANSGWYTKDFDPNSYLSYIATAGPGMYYSSNGYVISFTATANDLLSEYTTTARSTRTRTAITSATSTKSSYPTVTDTPSSSINDTTASTLSTLVSATPSATPSTTSGTNATAPAASQTVVTAVTNGGSKTAGFSSLTALLVLGMGAVALL